MTRTVLTYGTFDLFHIGHVLLLERAADLGDRLIVGISSDEFNSKKGKVAEMSFFERSHVVASCQFVDEVIEEKSWDQKERDLLRYKVDVFVMGDDWQGRFDHLRSLCEVVYLSRTPRVSSTDIRSSLVTVSQFG